MTISYDTVTLKASSITMLDQVELTITLAGLPTAPPTGTVHGAITVNDGSFKIQQINTLTYHVTIMGYRVHRCVAAPLFIVMADNDGPVEYTAISLTLSVTTPPIAYFPRPQNRIKQWFIDEWDATYVKMPKVFRQRELKSLEDGTLSEGVIVIKELETKNKVRARGDYFDGEYPCIVRVLQEGNRTNAEAYWEKVVSEVIRILGLKWNYIMEHEWDYLEFENNGVDNSDLGAGRYDWELRLKFMSPLRGRAGTPSDPVV